MRQERQIRTIPTTTWAIMNSREFARGFEDVRAGRPFDWRINSWSYERGRLLAVHVAPLNVPLRINGKLNPTAIALFDDAYERKLIL
jgi:hypothetical protein